MRIKGMTINNTSVINKLTNEKVATTQEVAYARALRNRLVRLEKRSERNNAIIDAQQKPNTRFIRTSRTPPINARTLETRTTFISKVSGIQERINLLTEQLNIDTTKGRPRTNLETKFETDYLSEDIASYQSINLEQEMERMTSDDIDYSKSYVDKSGYIFTAEQMRQIDQFRTNLLSTLNKQIADKVGNIQEFQDLIREIQNLTPMEIHQLSYSTILSGSELFEILASKQKDIMMAVDRLIRNLKVMIQDAKRIASLF